MKPPFTSGERVTVRRKSGEKRNGVVASSTTTANDVHDWSRHWSESVTIKFDGAPEDVRRFERQDGAGKWRTAKGHNKYTCSIFRACTTETTAP